MSKKKTPAIVRVWAKPPRTGAIVSSATVSRRSKTRVGTSPLAGHFPEEHSRAFRALAASQGKDVQELLAEAVNMVFKRYALPNRIEITSGRRTRGEA